MGGITTAIFLLYAELQIKESETEGAGEAGVAVAHKQDPERRLPVQGYRRLQNRREALQILHASRN